MRIRKRKVPLPIWSISPVPILSSDPYLPLVQLQPDQNPPRNLSLVADAASSFDPRPPVHPSQPSGARVEAVKVLPEEDGKKRGEFGGEKMMMTSSNDSRLWFGYRDGSGQLGSEIECTVQEQPSSSRDRAGGRWFEGEKAFPLKKMCESRNGKGIEEDGDEEVIRSAMDSASSGARKKERGGAILEGSRCSRVNGRGWRCCQQTLVGYSLCEHHLGKGRLRSMSNISRNKRSKAGNEPNSQVLSSSSLGSSLVSREEDQGTKANEVQGHDGGNVDEKKPAIIARRKTGKLRIFKARSLSSLLGLANEAISMAENET